VEPTATGNFKERRAAFKDGKDIDFSLVPVQAIQQMVKQQIPVEIADVFRRGFKILRALILNEGKDANTGTSRLTGPVPTLESDGYLILLRCTSVRRTFVPLFLTRDTVGA
jgi:hypothetical protein